MPTSIREQVVDAVRSKLAAMATGSPTLFEDLVVERTRGRPVGEDDFPRLVIEEGEQDKTEETDNHKQFTASIPIMGFVKASADTALGPALNDLYARVVEALEADKTLGLAFVLWSGEGPLVSDADEEKGHAPGGSFTLDWEVVYQVSVTDPYSAPS